MIIQISDKDLLLTADELPEKVAAFEIVVAARLLKKGLHFHQTGNW